MTDLTTTAPTTEESSTSVPHIDDSNVVPFTPPPYIPSRIIRPPKNSDFRGDPNAEAESIEKNMAWFTEHGGDTSKLETYSGLTMEVPENAPPSDLDTAAEDEIKKNE